MKGHELDVKTQECEEYEKSVVENQSMLQHSSARITELEDMQGELQRQVPTFKLCNSLHAFFWVSDFLNQLLHKHFSALCVQDDNFCNIFLNLWGKIRQTIYIKDHALFKK